VVQRLISVGAVALALALAGTVIAACYDVPAPDCGFVCGPNNACPDGYSCGSAQRCRRIDAPVTVVCSASDIDAGSHPGAGRPSDASIDSSGGGSGGSSGTGPPPDPGLQLVPP
jgi:hypothetical protein